MASTENEEDEIVEEIPIYLSADHKESLSILQFPTKTMSNAMQENLVKNCRMRPISGEIKIDFELGTDDTHFDHDKAERLAAQIDGRASTSTARKTYPNGIMDLQTFASTNSMGNVNNYVVGIIADNEVHVTPLKSILQMRPTFKYLSKAEKGGKAGKKTAAQQQAKEEEATPVMVKFSRPGQAGKKNKPKESLLSSLKKSSDELWCDMLWRNAESAAGEIARQKLFATLQEPVGVFSQEANKYKQKLLPLEAEQAGVDALLPTTAIGKRRLRLLPFLEQLQHFLKNGKVFSFNSILNYFQENINSEITAEQIIRILPQIGVLVNGNWVAQSEIKYPADSITATNGICGKLMARARDYVLFKLTRTGYVYRRQMLQIVQLPFQEAMEVLQSVAHLTTQDKWVLLLPPDHKFEQRYPELVQIQELFWRSTEATFNEMDNEKSPKRPRMRSDRERKISQTSNN